MALALPLKIALDKIPNRFDLVLIAGLIARASFPAAPTHWSNVIATKTRSWRCAKSPPKS